jgi:hypothetical protein
VIRERLLVCGMERERVTLRVEGDDAQPVRPLRAANLRIMGSGQGSVTTAAIVAELPALAAEITAGTLTVDAAPLPLSQVETAWNAPTEPGRRIVFAP